MPAETTKRVKPRRFAKLLPLAARSAPSKPSQRDLDGVFNRLAKRLQSTGVLIRVQFQLRKKQKKTHWNILLAGESSKMSRKPVPASDLSITMSEEDAWDIFRGKVPPLEVFASGRMLVTGDCKVIKRIYRRLATRGEIDFF